jgi:hypothetical protein
MYDQLSQKDRAAEAIRIIVGADSPIHSAEHPGYSNLQLIAGRYGLILRKKVRSRPVAKVQSVNTLDSQEG